MLFFLVNEQLYLKGESLAFLGLLTTCLRKTILKRKRFFTKLKRNVNNLWRDNVKKILQAVRIRFVSDFWRQILSCLQMKCLQITIDNPFAIS